MSDRPSAASVTVIDLPSVFDMRVLDDMREELMAALENGDLTVNASSIDRISTLSIQLLLSAGKSASQSGSSFSIQEPSEAFIASVKMLGLLEELEKWMIENESKADFDH